MGFKQDLPPDLEARMEQDHVPGIGITVFREGRVEWSRGFGVAETGTRLTVTNETPFHACSMSKMVTAVGVLRLVQEGVLDLDEEVNRYLVSWRVPESRYTEHKKVTLRNLLAHQGGFVDPEGSFDICREQDPVPSMADLLTGKTPYNPMPLSVAYTPESRFSYSDAGYCVVEQLVEDVTGEPFAQAMERLVMKPLGLKRTFYWNYGAGMELDGAGYKTNSTAAAGHGREGRTVDGKRAYYPYLAAAGLWSTPLELAKLAMAVLSSWNGDTDSILHPGLARLMLSGSGCEDSVGLGVFVPQDGEEPYMVSKGWGVGFQCMLLAYPRRQNGIVAMTNSDPGKPQHKALVGEVIRHFGKQYNWPINSIRRD